MRLDNCFSKLVQGYVAARAIGKQQMTLLKILPDEGQIGKFDGAPGGQVGIVLDIFAAAE